MNTSEIDTDKTINFELFDLHGRIIYASQKTEGWLLGEEWRINVSEIATGVYFLKVYSEEQRAVFKIVKI